MFFKGSRYEKMVVYSVPGADGKLLRAVSIPIPRQPQLLGFHRRLDGQRLDHIAAHYLSDPTAFWRLCDVSGTLLPDALEARKLVGIPVKGA